MTQLGAPTTPTDDAFRFGDESMYEAPGLYPTELESGS